MDKDFIKLTIPSKPNYVGVVRLTTSSIGNEAKLSIDDIEDIKVAISEACINAMGRSEILNIEYELYKNKLVMFVENVSDEIDSSQENAKEKELGILIISSLMDQVEFTSRGIKMIKKIEDGIDD
ncbi:ATP-binding protein [Anaerosalibacter massiliensis]|uniref:ATP-binding protein n=1 Tax=Anaerosalibacter massiliensis TaxID=1347392 RepID=UPI0005B29AD8|nr:ATP-binding protein [Anaerosalibacter massiliensis]